MVYSPKLGKWVIAEWLDDFKFEKWFHRTLCYKILFISIIFNKISYRKNERKYTLLWIRCLDTNLINKKS